jgi:hypothetical protein
MSNRHQRPWQRPLSLVFTARIAAKQNSAQPLRHHWPFEPGRKADMSALDRRFAISVADCVYGFFIF